MKFYRHFVEIKPKLKSFYVRKWRKFEKFRTEGNFDMTANWKIEYNRRCEFWFDLNSLWNGEWYSRVNLREIENPVWPGLIWFYPVFRVPLRDFLNYWITWSNVGWLIIHESLVNISSKIGISKTVFSWCSNGGRIFVRNHCGGFKSVQINIFNPFSNIYK